VFQTVFVMSPASLAVNVDEVGMVIQIWDPVIVPRFRDQGPPDEPAAAGKARTAKVAQGPRAQLAFVTKRVTLLLGSNVDEHESEPKTSVEIAIRL
jgi:hypothetical protein